MFQGCFSAAMSSSRSDKVTKFVRLSVCLSVVILSNLEHSKHLKQDVKWIMQRCLMGVSRVFQGCSKIAVMVFQEYPKAVFRTFVLKAL